MLGQLPPSIVTSIPGAASARWVEVLAQRECPSLTARRARREERSGARHDPIVWEAARGANVRDVDGNVFVDLTAGFGVVSVGHAHPTIVEAIERQSTRLIHGLGDVHPSVPKLELLERLAAIAPMKDARVILGANGSDAVAAALKTAVLATGRAGVIAFEGGYHGLMYGPLALCGYSETFRAPFAAQLNPHVAFAPYPRDDAELDRALASVDALFGEHVGAIVVEPMLGRGGIVVPPERFLGELSDRCRARGALLIVDEIFTGLGRTGAPFAHRGVTPDVLCLGKSLGGGLPISACIASSDVMRAWGDPSGEAIHTATFAGHPLACASALACLDVIEREHLAERSRELGGQWLRELSALTRHRAVREVRGRGLMIGIELDDGARTLALVRALSERGYLTLPAGRHAEVLSLTPPLTIAEELLRGVSAVLDEILEASA